VRTRRRSQHQAWVRAGRVEVCATSGGNGARQAAARALGPASAGVMRMKELGGLALAIGPRGGPREDRLERLLGEKIKKKKKEGGVGVGVGPPEKTTQQAWMERKMLSIFKTFYKF
jgi:hypothetical protein